jgi:APA family basic amino acid/polyamine antiporter
VSGVEEQNKVSSGPPTDAQGAPASPGNGSGSIGLPVATALVMGSIIGTGIFALPSALAPYGGGQPGRVRGGHDRVAGPGVGVWRAVATGARIRRPVRVYARDAFGDFAGFLNAWSYWITAWAGNAAIVVAWVGYVEVFLNTGHLKGWSVLIALVGLWIPAAINLSGLRNMGSVQVVTVVLKFLPLVFMATVGLFFMSRANFGAFNPSGLSFGGALSAAAAIALFSYLGLETASVAAGRVRDPSATCPRATMLGTSASAFVYILGTLAVFGLVPNAALQKSTAPFSDAANAMFGGGWAGDAVAVAAIISGLGALNGWTLIVAEMPYAAAKDRCSRRSLPIPAGACRHLASSWARSWPRC